MSPAHGSLLLGKCHSVTPHCMSFLGAARWCQARLVWRDYMRLQVRFPKVQENKWALSPDCVRRVLTTVRDAPMCLSSFSSQLRPRSDTVCSLEWFTSLENFPTQAATFHIAVISYSFSLESLLHTLEFPSLWYMHWLWDSLLSNWDYIIPLCLCVHIYLFVTFFFDCVAIHML